MVTDISHIKCNDIAAGFYRCINHIHIYRKVNISDFRILTIILFITVVWILRQVHSYFLSSSSRNVDSRLIWAVFKSVAGKRRTRVRQTKSNEKKSLNARI